MADNFIMNVSENFDLDAFVKQLVANFQAEGYSVNCLDLSGMKKIMIGKDNSGFKNFAGLGQGITVTCGVNNNMLNLTYSDGNWGFKIYQVIMGIIFFATVVTIPFLVCAIFGIVKQAKLPNKVSEAGKLIANQLEESNRKFNQSL